MNRCKCQLGMPLTCCWWVIHSRSCEGYVFTGVCLSTGGVCLSACWDTTPPAKETPLPRTPPVKETPPAKETPPQRRPPCQGDPLARRTPLGADTPYREMATAVDGTHPTGMHSFYNRWSVADPGFPEGEPTTGVMQNWSIHNHSILFFLIIMKDNLLKQMNSPKIPFH